MQPRSKSILKWGVVMATLIVVGIGIDVIRRALELPEKAYAMWTAGELITQHLELHGQEWPKSWEELKQTYDFLENEYAAVKSETNQVNGVSVVTLDSFLPSSFESMTNLVVIDWDADVAALQKAETRANRRPFRIVGLKNGRGTSYEGREPNAMIWDYLQTLTNPPPATAFE